jgi:uncharacterized protein (TIGR02284 family)
LIGACNDAAEGNAKAATGVHNQELSNWLARISHERERFAVDLAEATSELEGKPKADLQEAGILHGGWVALEQRLRPKDEQGILQECILGDTGTLKHQTMRWLRIYLRVYGLSCKDKEPRLRAILIPCGAE